MHNLVAVAYVISGIFFIIALRGLSSPESSRRGNIFGMLGMLIAVLATLFSVNFFTSNIQTVGLVLIAIVIGGLMEDREVTTQQGVPLLGSLPVLGNLFKNKIKNKRVIETVILLKATIIKNKKYHTKSDSILYNTFTRDRHHLGI